MSDVHRPIDGLEKREQELLQDPGIQDAYVHFEAQHLDEEILAQNRLLTEVDHLIDQRTAPYEFGDVDDNLQNYETAMQEQAMPFAITTTEHDIEIDRRTNKEVAMWLGRTALEVANSGYKFHKDKSVFPRIEVEKDEARRSATQEDDGRARIFISPKMSRQDAPLEIARSEHLGDDDAIRISWIKTLPDGTRKRVLQSLLVRDIPLEAWEAMLTDDDSIFGRRFHLSDPGSALSVMKLHDQLELDREKLPNGPVSIIEAVIPYIDDITTRKKVIEQSKRYYGDQEEMQREAQAKAQEWLTFDKELAESLIQEEATSMIKGFVYSLQHNWGKSDLVVLKEHELPNAGYRMTRKLAAMLESAQQKLLAGRAALTTNPDHVLKQLRGDRHELERLQANEQLIAIALKSGMDHVHLLNQQQRTVAARNLDGGGGGCPGKNATLFDGAYHPDALTLEGQGEKKGKRWKWKRGHCRVESCSSRPGETDVGPCDVCRSCQRKFDQGRDPTKEKPVYTRKETVAKSAGKIFLAELKNERFALAA